MLSLEKGGNCALPPGQLRLALRWATPATPTPDVSAYVVSEAGKVSGDPDMVFYGQRQSGDSAVSLDGDTFTLDLARLRPNAAKVAFAAAFHDPAGAFAHLGALEAVISGDAGDIAAFHIDLRGLTEKALILVEVYRRDGAFKFRAVGQGFNGGLRPLSEHFGVEIADEPPPPAPEPPKTKLSLSKITLDKSRPTIDLSKGAGAFGEIRINLNWSRTQSRSSFFGGGGASGVDLDLGCLYELRNGEKGTVQALGDAFGDYHHEPYIQLDGDDRTGDVAGGEWMRINGKLWDRVKRVLVYAFIYEGVPNWAQTNGVVTLYVPDQPEVSVPMNDSGSGHRMCAVALLENVAGSIRMTRKVEYYSGHKQVDRAHSWGLNWVAGSK